MTSLSVAVAAVALLAAPSRAQSLEALSAQAGLVAPPPAALRSIPVPDLPTGRVVPAPAAAVKPADVSGQGRAAPNWQVTPGKLCTTSDPDFKEMRYAEQIPYCQRNVNYAKKQQVAQQYGVPESDWPNYEFDHLIPLAIGGDSDVTNLWPQPKGPDGSNGKDALENQLYHEMADGTISQADAVREIYAWFGASAPMSATALKTAPKAPALAAR